MIQHVRCNTDVHFEMFMVRKGNGNVVPVDALNARWKSTALLVFNLGARWSKLSTPRPGSSVHRKEPQYSLNRRLGSSKSQSHPYLTSARIRTLNSPTHNLVNKPTTLSRLLRTFTTKQSSNSLKLLHDINSYFHRQNLWLIWRCRRNGMQHECWNKKYIIMFVEKLPMNTSGKPSGWWEDNIKIYLRQILLL